jgi:hypothetical protein
MSTRVSRQNFTRVKNMATSKLKTTGHMHVRKLVFDYVALLWKVNEYEHMPLLNVV